MTTKKMIDLWARHPATVMPEALEEGFRKFTWHVGLAMARRMDPIARMRAYALPFGQDCRLMLIDFAGAPEYDLFSNYERPLAVYPTWTPSDGFNALKYLCENPPGDNPKFYGDSSIPRIHRPVKGQKHRIVVHRVNEISTHTETRRRFCLSLLELQETYVDVEIFLSGFSNLDHLVGMGFRAGDFQPFCIDGLRVYQQLTLPSGKFLSGDKIYDPRYSDWFDLLGISQVDLIKNLKEDRRLWPRYEFRAAQWARRNWHKVEPFILDRRGRTSSDEKDLSNRILRSNDEFILPATRRRVMRNLGLAPIDDLDEFTCDTCIMHNTCTLYRAGSVCILPGAETVALAEGFGTRSAAKIIEGLHELVKIQAERVEDAIAAEASSGETDDKVTKQINSLFANGVKLAKLLDPALNGGPRVAVNVGVAAGGRAEIVAAADPRQLTAQIIAEIEAQGIKREDITQEMIAAYLKALGVGSDDPGIRAIEATAGKKLGKRVPEPPVAAAPTPKLPEDYAPDEVFRDVAIDRSPVIERDFIVLEGEVTV